MESGSGSVLRKTESTAHAHQSRARIVPGYRARASHHASTQLSRAPPHTQYDADDVPYRTTAPFVCCVSIIRDSLVIVTAVFIIHLNMLRYSANHDFHSVGLQCGNYYESNLIIGDW